MYDCFCIAMAELKPYGQERLKYLLPDPLQKSLPAPDFATKFHLI